MKTANIVLSTYGQEAVDIGYKFQGDYCFRGIYNHGKRIAQLEVVIDEPGYYNGLQKKWVDVTVLGNNLEATLKQLRRLGFSGIWALCFTEDEDGHKLSDEVFFKI